MIFVVPTSAEIATAQQKDDEIRQIREWIHAGKCPNAEDLAPLSGRLKSFVQLLANELSLREDVLILKEQTIQNEV